MSTERHIPHLGGEGEEWNFWFSVSSFASAKEYGRFYFWNVDFRARDDKEAKAKVLKILKQKVGRLKSMRNRVLGGMAAPRLLVDGKGGCDGDRMIRVRFSYSYSKKLLRVRDPNRVLVQGHGPEALEELNK